MNTWDIINTLRKYKVVPRLADGQLRLAGEISMLPPELLEEVREKKEELKVFLKAAMDQHAYMPIPSLAPQEDYPASNSQKRLWVLSKMDGGNTAYNIVRSFYLKGTVIAEHLNQAFRLLVRRHESLRTIFREAEGDLRQIVPDDIDFNISVYDISAVPDIPGYLAEKVAAATFWEFNPEKGPLVRVDLYRMAEDEYALFFGVHHIVCDGWSIGVIVAEVMRAYEAYCKGEAPVDIPLSIQYKDYCSWHSDRMAGDKGAQAALFWKAQFAEIPEPLQLPADSARDAIRSFDGAVSRYYPDAQLLNRIQLFCGNQQVSAFNFYRAALMLLLGKLSGQDDITIGCPVSGRNHLDLEAQVGLYVNTLPLRAQIDPEETVQDFIKRISAHSIQAFEFQDYPFDSILEALDISRDLSRNPLFDVMLATQDTAAGEGSVNKHQQYGFTLSLLDKYLHPDSKGKEEKAAAKFDLTFNLDFEPDNRFYIEIEYDARLFRKERIEGLFQRYLYVMDEMMAKADVLVKHFNIITPAERDLILHTFNSPVMRIEEHSILSLLGPSLWENGEKIALMAGDHAISYYTLDTDSSHVAAHLTALLRMADNARIGLLMGRTAQAVVSIIAALKAGVAYVPVDISYPAARISYIIDDAQLAVLITDDEGREVVPEDYSGKVIHIDTLIKTAIPPTVHYPFTTDLREHTAYVIYTSGSSGNPKGVEICHRNTIAFLKWAQQEFAATPFEILYASTSFCFDLSIFELLFPLLKGKTIRLLSSALEIYTWHSFDKHILINTVPSVVRSLLDKGMDWTNISALNMAGEAVPERFKKELDWERMEVRNLYGPTEDTTYSTVYRFEDKEGDLIPIGKPVGYTQLYIMDPHQQLLPVGIEGEIVLSGQSIAKGYLDRPVLTTEKFLPNPFLPELMMYRTGDIGRWTADGKVIFIGRKDEQVKIRGYRIETDEIRHRLEQHPHVDQAVVMVRNVGGEDAIIAYFTGNQAVPELLKEYLAGILPAFMIPSYWVPLDKMPLNSNGKIDRKKLPDPQAVQEKNRVMTAPATPLQQQLAALWKDVLGTTIFDIKDSFFDKGGHSLKAARLQFLIRKELGKDITLNEIFLAPTIEKQATLLSEKHLLSETLIPVAAEEEQYPISPAQERLWVLTRFMDASMAYHMPALFSISGELDRAVLKEAFQRVIERYEILRTVFTEQDGIPMQRVLLPGSTSFTISEIATDDVSATVQSLLKKPFDLINGPLLRCVILQTKEKEVLYFDMHHIISDGWSLEVLFKNIALAYRLAMESPSALLPAPGLQYKDFAIWQRARMEDDLNRAHREFWMKVLGDALPQLALPTDHKRPDVKTYNGDSYHYSFGGVCYQQLMQLSRYAGASLFMTLMAMVRVLLKKYAGQKDIVIGTPVSGRTNSQLQDQIGFFVNTLPIRLQVDNAESFLSLLQREKEIVLAAYEHQELQLEQLAEDLQLKRDLSRNPIFDVTLVLHHGDSDGTVGDLSLTSDIRLERIPLANSVSKYDLVFLFEQQGEQLGLTVEYNTDLFKQDTIQWMTKHLHTIMDQVCTMPDMPVRDIVLPDEEERRLLLSKADQTGFEYDHTATVISLFQEAVQRFPDKTALIAGDRSLTYKALDELSGKLAGILIHEYAVQQEELIAVVTGRNEWMLIAILAILKAGAAYVPVDPDYPEARFNYILDDCGCRLVLTDQDIYEDSSNRHFINITQKDFTQPIAQATVQPFHLAYVIYTSGTTGKPKGVLIEHRHIARLLFHEGNLFDFNSDDRWSLFHSYCFDFSVWEMYGALLYGGTLVIVPKHIAQDGAAFYDFLASERITVLNQTPTAFRSMIQANAGRVRPALSVRYLIFGGEAMMPGILEAWHQEVPQCRNINMYGITETTVHVTYKEINTLEIKENKSNIGIPIPTVSCYVLDEDGRQVPVGLTGELCVGGAGVARGYLHRPELTAARFIENPFRKGEKLYRSGDFARILPNGDLEYIGRKDDQVKIRGHRIELAEIEAALFMQPDIQDAVVIPVRNRDDEFELTAYYIPSPMMGTATQLRKALATHLPAFMVPAYLVPLERFPVNSNGKLDKSALPAPWEVLIPGEVQTSCRNELDALILKVWEEVLQRTGIGIRDNFFDLGGHSLKATRVVSRIHELTGIRVDLRTLFLEPTIEHLSDYVETLRWMEDRSELIPGDQNEILL
ncbi:amino acid adenylation domain-containing protein [Chitinophaga sp.]|uniref:amino acid adenylation domain-containing protein n=1 Tax=Chitinophaga sp. TaxID=1869181 RepID=UPI0031CE3570